MTRMRIVPETDPNADGHWIEVPTRIVDLLGIESWFKAMEKLHLDDVPPGYSVVQFETIGGTFLRPETSDDSKRDPGIMSNST